LSAASEIFGAIMPHGIMSGKARAEEGFQYDFR